MKIVWKVGGANDTAYKDYKGKISLYRREESIEAGPAREYRPTTQEGMCICKPTCPLRRL